MKTGLVCLLIAGGCAQVPAVPDAAFGETTRHMLAQQIRDAGASERHAGVSPDGLDGRAAREVMERYVKSFAAPPPPGNVFSIGLASGAAARGGEAR